MVDRNRAAEGASVHTLLIILLLVALFATASFFTATTDATLQESSDILTSALSGLPTGNQHLSNASISTIHTLSEALKNISKNAKFVSDNSLHQVETASIAFVQLLRNEYSESHNTELHGAIMNKVATALETFAEEIGSFYFIANDELGTRLHKQISNTVYELRDISLAFSDAFGDFSANIQKLIQRRVNYQQLIIDLNVAVTFIALLYTLSAHRNWQHVMSLCSLPLVTFVAFQLLQWRTRRVFMESISPPASFAVIILVGCITATLSATRSGIRVQLLMAVLIALSATGTQLCFHSHVCSIRGALGAPCPTEMSCPINAVQLATYDIDSKQMSVSQNAVFRLPRLSGPLYVLSEIGGFNTGKSARLTVSYRMLLPKVLRDKCRCGFIVRNADADPSLVHTGKTRGLWMMSLPVSQIEPSDIASEPLRKAVQRLDPTGSIIFLDSEGGEEAGQEAASINLMQLLVVQLSSHVNLAIKDSISPGTISHLGHLAHLWRLYTVFEQGRQSCQHVHEPNDASVSHPEFAIISMKGSELLPVFPDIKSSDGEVISLPSVFSLDATHILHSELQKAMNKTHTKDAASQVKKYMGTLAYWGTLPATKIEMNFFKRMDTESGLPSSGNAGFILGWSVFNFPAILNRVQPKNILTKPIDGADFLQFMRQFLHITRAIKMEWLGSENTKDLSAAICKHVSENVNGILKSAEHLAESLPIESKPVCINPKDKCPDADFEKVWSKISQNITETLCFMKNLMPENGWAACWRDEVQPKVSKTHEKLLKKNLELCDYRWSTEEWNSTCEGLCPGYRSRDRTCLSSRHHPRPSRCCSGKDEPEVRQSCELWSYEWSWNEWSQCDKKACGTQTRSVFCLRCDGEKASDEMCPQKGEKPPTSQQCNVHYSFESGSWSSCSCGAHQIRDVWCQSNCGRKANMDKCDRMGPIPSTSNYCGNCPSYESSDSCFGSKNFVHTEDGTKMKITSLHPGLKILTGKISDDAAPIVTTDEIAFFMTTYERKHSNFVTIHTAMNTTITLTGDHLLPVKFGHISKHIELLPARDLKPDRHLLLMSTDQLQQSLRWVAISHVQTGVTDSPVVLLTMQDYALVSNIVASCHTGNEMIGKAIAFPVKMIYKVFGVSAADSDIVRGAVQVYDQLIGY